MTDTNLDRAAQMAGYDDWADANRMAPPRTRGARAIRTIAATLDELDAAKAELDAAKAELEAFKREVSEAVEAYADKDVHAPVTYLGRFIITKPDPLVEVCREIGLAPYRPDQLRAALAKHGLKLERIDQ